jgi:hypothetical protein
MPNVTWFEPYPPRPGEVVDLYVSAFQDPEDKANDWGFVPRYSFAMRNLEHLLGQIDRITRARAGVRRLYLGGHGSPGCMDFGTDGEWLTLGFVLSHKTRFRDLGRCFARPASIILAACNVAMDTRGSHPQSLLGAGPSGPLAQALSVAVPGVYVIASLTIQWGGTRKMLGAVTTFLDGRLLGMGWQQPTAEQQRFLPEFQKPPLLTRRAP